MPSGRLCLGQRINASEIDLEQQGLSGAVSGYSGAAPTTFILTLPADSAFATLTGSTTMTVFQQAGTELRGMTTITNGSTVHVRGLLFFDAGTYKLVAGQIVLASSQTKCWSDNVHRSRATQPRRACRRFPPFSRLDDSGVGEDTGDGAPVPFP